MSKEMKNSGIPWIGDIPKDWRIVRNKNVFSNSKILVGDAWNTTQLLSLTTKGIKAVAIGSTSGKVPDSYDTYQVVEKDNIVMCLFDLDCSAVFSGLSPIHGMISPAYKALTIKNGFLPDFYAKWFDYIFDGRKFMFLSKNIRYSLTYDEFASLQVVAPSLLEQQKIASFLDKKCSEIDEMIALQEKIVEELKAYRQSVITEAVTKGLNPDVPMKDSGIEWIGEIPEHWEVLKSKKILLSNDGGVWGEEPDGIDDTVVLRSTEQDIDGKLIIIEPAKRKLSLKEREASLLKRGDLIITKSSGSPSHIGKTSIIDEGVENLGCCYSNFIQRIRVKGEPKYYWYIFNSLIVKKQFEYLSTTTTGINNINSKIIEALFLPCTSAEEQEGIALYLDTKCTEIDNLISIKLSKIDSLKEYKKSIIYEYVTGKKEVIE